MFIDVNDPYNLLLFLLLIVGGILVGSAEQKLRVYYRGRSQVFIWYEKVLHLQETMSCVSGEFENKKNSVENNLEVIQNGGIRSLYDLLNAMERRPF